METLEKTGNDGILQVKSNQKFLLRDCERTASEETPIDVSTSRTRGHGRREKRTAQVFTSLASFSASITKQWGKYIRAVIKVTRDKKEFSTKAKQWKTSREEAYYIATKAFSARESNAFIRRHWWIENKNHFVRDVTMREDASRIRRNPDRMVRLRSFALNVLRENGEKNIALAQYENSLSLTKVLEYRGFEP